MMNILDDNYDEPTHPRRNISGVVWNVLTLLVLISVLCVVGLFLLIFTNPYSALNPFPPPTLPAAILLPSATPTPRELLPPTWTPAPTKEPTATNTPRPTATLPPTSTPFSLITPTPGTPTATEKASRGMPYAVQSGSPVSIANIAHPEASCNWLGVAGQVVALNGSAVPGQQVQLGGSLGGNTLPGGTMLTLTGLAPQYGVGYYEFTLADHPIASKGTLWVQLLNQAGQPMSDKIHFDTFEECQKNLIIINIKQMR